MRRDGNESIACTFLPPPYPSFMKKEGTKTAQRGASKAAGRQDWLEFDSRACQSQRTGRKTEPAGKR